MPGVATWRSRSPEAARTLKAQVVANQLERLGGYRWDGPERCANRLSATGPTGWRTRVRLDVGPDGRPGFHRYHSDELVTDLRCAQLPAGMLDGLGDTEWPPGAHLHVALDDDGRRHVVSSVRAGKRTTTTVAEGDYAGGAAGGPAYLAGAGDGLLAGAPRRGDGLQRSGRGLGSSPPRA